ncbi:BNR repeat-containing protein [Pedobacter sp. D749]|uniref:BNR repeat-containing protein n=1 Tax=Pedobacter sp. D749 TaxID=2856523 RepID=UPI001C561839|nr:BNR repeat-containing protein [Pedobacter sp. D749]QXU43087.1 BNR repeat-containing protein [Pedobacter sp. D749]
MYQYLNKNIFLICVFVSVSLISVAQETQLSTIASNGWANNSVNTVIFRKNSLISFKGSQYAAYYDHEQNVVLAKRKIGSTHWTSVITPYKGDATDAHKSISIMIDGDGFLHIAWGQHNNNLNYARSVSAGSLTLGKKEVMLSAKENKVSYPEFYKLTNGDLLFFYRDGGSGNGNLMINHYSLKTRKWTRIQDGMIDGEGQRNAYWQVAVDQVGTIHLSWVWRESPDVASNHDLCYAKSTDGGITWLKSTGEKYQLPITATNAEYTVKIPQKSELINQTSMFADAKGKVFIAGYWRGVNEAGPQYHLVFKTDNSWKVSNLNFRKTTFSLSGTGTKRIPISRPQIIVWSNGKHYAAGLLFRDAERGNKASIALNDHLGSENWIIKDLTKTSMGDWEPTYDTELWKTKGILSLFLQNVTQIDGEGKADHAPTKVQVLDWKPKK